MPVGKVLIVDDHPIILWGLKAMVEQMVPGAQVRALGSGREARELFRTDADHDLVLLDLELADDDGLALLAHLRECNPSLTVVVMSGSERREDVMYALDLGVMGFLPKRLSTEALTDALKLVLAGGVYVPPLPPAEPAPAGRPAVPSSQPTPSSQPDYALLADLSVIGLTPRQSEVLMLMLRGKQNKEIARLLDVSVETVKDHVSVVLRTLGVSTRTQAVLAVAELQKHRRRKF